MHNNTAVIHNFRVASLSPSFLPSLLVTPAVSALSLAGNRPPQTVFWPMRRQCLRSSRLIPVENCSYQVAENSYEIHWNQPRARSVRFFRWICKCSNEPEPERGAQFDDRSNIIASGWEHPTRGSATRQRR